jgi:hypothetical protein
MIHESGLSAARQADYPPAAAAEGLPFWLLLALICVALLLAAFFLLRNEAFRLRLNVFFSGARRRMTVLRLKTLIKREKERKRQLLVELGKKAWSEGLTLEGVEAETEALSSLDRELANLHAEWHGVFSRIQELEKKYDSLAAGFQNRLVELKKLRAPVRDRLKSLRAEKKEVAARLRGAKEELRSVTGRARLVRERPLFPELVADAAEKDPAAREEAETGQSLEALAEHARAVRAKVEELEARAALLEEETAGLEERAAVLASGIRDAEEERRSGLDALEMSIILERRARDRVQKGILTVRRQMDPHFEALGRALARERLEREDLELLYIQYDAIENKLAELDARLKELL